MGITEILRRIWLFFASKTKSSEYFNKQPTQLIVKLNSSLRHIIVTQVFCGSLLQMLTRIQLHILAGYNVKENNNRLPEKIQETFLQLRSQPFT